MRTQEERLRTYVDYKNVSGDLFRNIEGHDLTSVSSWSTNELVAYQNLLVRGYVRNKECQRLRSYFRDEFVPDSQRDHAHERAIQNAAANVETYEALIRELQKALGQFERTGAFTAVRQKTRKGKNPRKKKNFQKETPQRSVDELDWRESLKDAILQAETELKAQVHLFYSRAFTKILDKSESCAVNPEVTVQMLVTLLSPASGQRGMLSWHERVNMAAVKMADMPDSFLEKVIADAGDKLSRKPGWSIGETLT